MAGTSAGGWNSRPVSICLRSVFNGLCLTTDARQAGSRPFTRFGDRCCRTHPRCRHRPPISSAESDPIRGLILRAAARRPGASAAVPGKGMHKRRVGTRRRSLVGALWGARHLPMSCTTLPPKQCLTGFSVRCTVTTASDVDRDHAGRPRRRTRRPRESCITALPTCPTQVHRQPS